MEYAPNLMKENQKMSTDHASKYPQILPGSQGLRNQMRQHRIARQYHAIFVLGDQIQPNSSYVVQINFENSSRNLNCTTVVTINYNIRYLSLRQLMTSSTSSSLVQSDI